MTRHAPRRTSVAATVFALSLSASAGCYPYTEAPKHVGETVCIAGTVLKVGESRRSGTRFLNFCLDYRHCEFAVVMFPRDAERFEDVRSFEGKRMEIHGRVQKFNGQAEIVLEDPQQLKGEYVKAPPLEGQYDAENAGRNSAGSAYVKKPKKAKKKKPTTFSVEDTPQ